MGGVPKYGYFLTVVVAPRCGVCIKLANLGVDIAVVDTVKVATSLVFSCNSIRIWLVYSVAIDFVLICN